MMNTTIVDKVGREKLMKKLIVNVINIRSDLMQTFSFQPTQNVLILNFDPDQNFNGNSNLYVGQASGTPNTDYRSLLQFDISSIPVGSTITGARLKLYIAGNSVPGLSKPTQIFRLLEGFDANTVTFNNQPNRSSTASAVTVITSQIDTYITWDITTLVNGWYNGSIPNNGIIVIGVESQSALTQFKSTFFDDSNEWPVLEIDFVQGINTQFSVENVVTGNTFAGSTSISLGPRSSTFVIKNTGGANDAVVKLQISSDGTTWFDNGLPFVSNPVLGPGETITLNTDGNMAFARVAYKSQISGQSTSLSITPATTEDV